MSRACKFDALVGIDSEKENSDPLLGKEQWNAMVWRRNATA
jgi:hypothetical protein